MDHYTDYTILIDDRRESSVVHLACVTAMLIDLEHPTAHLRLSLHFMVKSREFDHGSPPTTPRTERFI
jgi:hypothetical protein